MIPSIRLFLATIPVTANGVNHVPTHATLHALAKP